jgi:hypothetical protein
MSPHEVNWGVKPQEILLVWVLDSELSMGDYLQYNIVRLAVHAVLFIVAQAAGATRRSS